MLEDDRHYFPPYDALTVVRAAALEEHPGLRAALETLAPAAVLALGGALHVGVWKGGGL